MILDVIPVILVLEEADVIPLSGSSFFFAAVAATATAVAAAADSAVTTAVS